MQTNPIMNVKRKSNGYWTKERCAEEALKYKTKTEFRKGSPGAESASIKNGWVDAVCGHMLSPQYPKGHWQSFDNCRLESLKYQYIYDFKNILAELTTLLENRLERTGT